MYFMSTFVLTIHRRIPIRIKHVKKLRSGAQLSGINTTEYRRCIWPLRLERYRGTDEEFAVIELYDRLQSEIDNQKLRYAAEMAERERNKYEENQTDEYRVLKDEILQDYGNSIHSGDTGRNDDIDLLKKAFSIVIIIISLLFGLAGFGGRGGYSSYNDDNYSYSSSYSHDSGWSSDNWDSGYTDWNSDW